jgi:hypothetical protein
MKSSWLSLNNETKNEKKEIEVSILRNCRSSILHFVSEKDYFPIQNPKQGREVIYIHGPLWALYTWAQYTPTPPPPPAV